MMTVRRHLSALLLTAPLLLSAPMSALAQDAENFPVDQQSRLDQLDTQALQKMNDLSAARLRGDSARVNELQTEFNAIQKERAELLRATGKLPPEKR